MKILTETPTKLVIQDRSIYYQLILGAVLAVASFYVFYLSIMGSSINGIWLALFFFISAVVSIINIEEAVTEINKQTGIVRVVKGPIYHKTIQKIAIPEIIGIKLERDTKWRFPNRNFYGVRLCLVLSNQTDIQLNLNLNILKFPDFYIHISANAGEVGGKIAQFLNVPFEKVGRFGSLLTKGY